MDETDLQHIVVERLHASPDGYRSLVREIAAAHPTLPAATLEAALQTAARQIDANLRRAGRPTVEARLARRLAVLLGMDVDLVAARLGAAPTMADMEAHWRDGDDFFLRL